MRSPLILLTAALVCAAPRASAQERAAALVVVDGGAPRASVRRWRARVEAALPAEPVELEAWARARQPAGTVDPSRLAVVGRIQRLLVDAKAAAARLRERDALTGLARAEALAERHLEIPGMASWYAEIQLAVAVTAAQAGLDGLSDAALRRAASVDPSRGVQAAEALPEVVERGRAAVRAAVTGPHGRFEVRADVPGAVVALDDRVLGPLPRVVDAPVGMHVLRVDAPGHRGWARAITVFEGERPPVSVRLAPTELTMRVRRLREVARAGDARAVASILDELPGSAPRVWLLWPGAERDRAVLVGCEAGRCGAVRRLDDRGLAADPGIGEPGGDLSAALRWMGEPDETEIPTEPPWWQRWYFWAGVGAVLAAGVAAAVVAAQPQGEGPWDVVVDPSPWEPFAGGDVD